MRIQNTLENKAKFFAQYWGQNIANDDNSLRSLTLTVNPHIAEWTNGFFLELTPLSHITDEDASKIAWLCNIGVGFAFEYKAIKSGLQLSKLPNIPQPAVDYLRSKGYAVPWLDLSVDDLVAYEWIKLKP